MLISCMPSRPFLYFLQQLAFSKRQTRCQKPMNDCSQHKKANVTYLFTPLSPLLSLNCNIFERIFGNIFDVHVVLRCKKIRQFILFRQLLADLRIIKRVLLFAPVFQGQGLESVSQKLIWLSGSVKLFFFVGLVHRNWHLQVLLGQGFDIFHWLVCLNRRDNFYFVCLFQTIQIKAICKCIIHLN